MLTEETAEFSPDQVRNMFFELFKFSHCIYNKRWFCRLLKAKVIKRVNKYLSSSKTRAKGLSLILKHLHQCSDSAATENCVIWMQQCCKNDYDNLKVTSTSFEALSKLFSYFNYYRALVFSYTLMRNCPLFKNQENKMYSWKSSRVIQTKIKKTKEMSWKR